MLSSFGGSRSGMLNGQRPGYSEGLVASRRGVVDIRFFTIGTCFLAETIWGNS